MVIIKALSLDFLLFLMTDFIIRPKLIRTREINVKKPQIIFNYEKIMAFSGIGLSFSSIFPFRYMMMILD